MTILIKIVGIEGNFSNHIADDLELIKLIYNITRKKSMCKS